MNQHEDLIVIAKTVIDSTLYMVLGTSDEAGQPWVSPVYFTASNYREFYWISSPETKHSRNIAKRSSVSIVIFNSQVPVGKAQAVYMSAAADELIGNDLERGLVLYEEVRPPGPYRLYRAVALEHWMLDPHASADHRIPVTV